MHIIERREMTGSSRWLRVFAVGLALGVLFGVSEVSLRVFRPQNTYSRMRGFVEEAIYAPSPLIPFTLKPSLVASGESLGEPGPPVTYTINAMGMRGPEVALQKPAGIRRILTLGDSFTYGLYVQDAECYPAVLRSLLGHEGKAVEVLNAGYTDGYDTDEHYAWLAGRGLQFAPDVVTYGFFIGNDLRWENRSQWVELDDEQLPTRIINDRLSVDSTGVLRSTVADQWTVGSERIYRVPALRESHLAILLFRRISWLLQEPPNWVTHPHPFILSDRSDADMELQEETFKRLVVGMQTRSESHGARFLLIMIPMDFQVDSAFLPRGQSVRRNFFEEMKPWLAEHHIAYVDLLEQMRLYPGHYYPANGEGHFNASGHRFAAERIRQKLSELGWI